MRSDNERRGESIAECIHYIMEPSRFQYAGDLLLKTEAFLGMIKEKTERCSKDEGLGAICKMGGNGICDRVRHFGVL